ncbi:MAG: DUF721 domain-containing protein [Nitrospirae bacterium]|nr:DUF721 domain-containing protein [Nitrospirota bacterium]MBI3392813.1 DUF721 domain-containing protein [Nitrospirota bacterium]
MAAKERRLRSIREILGRVVDSCGIAGRLDEQSVIERWAEAVGPEIARHTCALRVSGRVLHVTVDTSPWAQELSLLKPLILEALARVGGKSVVRDVRFAVGVLPPRPPQDPQDVPRDVPQDVKAAPDRERAARRITDLSPSLESVPDPALRERLAKILVKHVETSRGSTE